MHRTLIRTALEVTSASRRLVDGGALNGAMLASHGSLSGEIDLYATDSAGVDGGLAAALEEMVAVNRNARRPKKVGPECCLRTRPSTIVATTVIWYRKRTDIPSNTGVGCNFSALAVVLCVALP